MKTFKKALSIILGAAIMLSCLFGMQVSVAAEGTTLDVAVGEATVADGVVTVPVEVKNNPGFQALTVTVAYDNTVLTLTNAVKNTKIFTAEDSAVFGPTDANPFKMMWAYALTTENVTATGTIATLTFNVVEGATAESTDITLNVSEAWDVAKDDVVATATAGTVEFCEYVDANQDGRCDNCGEENLDETLAFYGKGMVLGADIRGIFQVRKMKATSPYASFKVIVENEGVESEFELAATCDKTSHTTYGYAITVAPKEMVDIMYARIVGITAEGEAYISNVDTWSIKQGLIDTMGNYSTLTTETAVNTMKLCANMLNYGAEAQKNFDYKADTLATDGLSAEYAAYIITTTPEMNEIAATDDTGATAPLKYIGFNLAAKVEILPAFTVPKADLKEDYSAEVTQVHTAPDGTETTKSFTIDGADCVKSSTTFAVYVNNLASNELRDVLTVTLYKNGVVVSATHTFSAESVAKGMLSSYPTLIPAMMNYGDCARAVFK